MGGFGFLYCRTRADLDGIFTRAFGVSEFGGFGVMWFRFWY